jgi:hypothetical protein
MWWLLLIVPTVLADPDAAAVDTSDQPTCIDVFTAYDDACTQCAPVSDPVTICGPGTRWSDVRQQCVCECAQDVTAEFGIYQYGTAIDGWSMASIADINTHRDDFMRQYNESGLPVIQSFVSDNCCIAVDGGEKLVISNTPYGYQFPATDGDSIRCNPSGGYSGTVHFYRAPVLTENMVFSSQTACAGSNNPTIYIRDTVSEGVQSIEFGLGDREGAYNGWSLASLTVLNTYKTSFITSYNNNGLVPIETFQSGNCCIALANGHKLIISDTPYGYQFPASTGGGIRCNPSGGYNEAAYIFYRAPTLNQNVVFTERAACATSHNPAIWYRFT